MAQQYADANIDQYAKRPSQARIGKGLSKKGYQQIITRLLVPQPKFQFYRFFGIYQADVFLNREMERFTGRVDASNKYKRWNLE